MKTGVLLVLFITGFSVAGTVAGVQSPPGYYLLMPSEGCSLCVISLTSLSWGNPYSTFKPYSSITSYRKHLLMSHPHTQQISESTTSTIHNILEYIFLKQLSYLTIVNYALFYSTRLTALKQFLNHLFTSRLEHTENLVARECSVNVY